MNKYTIEDDYPFDENTLNVKQIKEEYPVGSLVKVQYSLVVPGKPEEPYLSYGIVVGHSGFEHLLPCLYNAKQCGVLVRETTGKEKNFDYRLLEVVGKAINKGER
jgi:hypothetical protein